MPLAFALVEAENNVNWEWFFHLLRTKVLPTEREICVISDRHQGILNAVEIDIPGHPPLHHRWCMRHFCANFFRACGKKELADDLEIFLLLSLTVVSQTYTTNCLQITSWIKGGKIS